MKILVFSDSHGYEDCITNAINEHSDAAAIVFLGDGERDFENALAECGIAPFGSRKGIDIYQVRGNCDRCSNEAVTITTRISGVNFLITHGHDQNVKLGMSRLVDEAKRRGCQAALYGHTHRKMCQERDGILLINPGSAGQGNYALLDVNSEGKITQLL